MPQIRIVALAAISLGSLHVLCGDLQCGCLLTFVRGLTRKDISLKQQV